MAAAVRRTFRGQGVARAGGGRNVQKEQGPRGQDERKAEQQWEQFIRGDAWSCGQLEGARRSRLLLFPSQKVDELREIYF